MSQFHATTIFAVQHNGNCAMAGDGQVTFGNAVVMKHTARKVRKLFNGKVIAGFAGSVADAFTLFEMFEGKLEEYNGNLQRAAVELAKQWRSDKVLRKLEAMLIVMNAEPNANKNLAAEMMKNQLLISEYPPYTKPDRWQFPMRNRIISGISKGTRHRQQHIYPHSRFEDIH